VEDGNSILLSGNGNAFVFIEEAVAVASNAASAEFICG